MLLGCSSMSTASLIIWSMYLVLVERMMMSWSWIRWPRLMCLAMADLSGCFRCAAHAPRPWSQWNDQSTFP
jgi:hypothetical protein